MSGKIETERRARRARHTSRLHTAAAAAGMLGFLLWYGTTCLLVTDSARILVVAALSDRPDCTSMSAEKTSARPWDARTAEAACRIRFPDLESVVSTAERWITRTPHVSGG